MPCYAFQGRSSSGTKYVYFACVFNPEWVLNPQSPGGSLYIPGENGNPIIPFNSWWTTNDAIVLCKSPAQIENATTGRRVRGSCNACYPPEAVFYDYLNGTCIPSSDYNTPGKYESEEDCELANKCNLTEQEFNEINRLINNIKDEKCG